MALLACSGPPSSPDAGASSAGGATSGGTTSAASSGGTGCATSCGSASSAGAGTSGTSGGSGGSHGSSGTSGTGSSSGGTTGSAASTGGTGGGCAAVGASCALANCCSGATCDLGTQTCVAAACGQIGGPCNTASDCCSGLSCQNFVCSPPCAGPGASCASASCCSGLTCTVTSPSSEICEAPPDGGCGPSPLGGPCLTMANCLRGLVCSPKPDAGSVCATPITPSAACVANGQACGGSEPCCGSCDGGLCVPRRPCAVTGGACAGDGDCCAGFGCNAGACAPTCGAADAPCDPSHGNGDCCLTEGLTCVSAGIDAGRAVCAYAQYAGPNGPLDCGAPCSGFPCTLGTTCQPPSASGSTDPCAAAGLVCDPTYDVCRQPGEFDVCQPGGPPCLPIAGSTATDLMCLPEPALFGSGVDLCLQPCSPNDPASGTSDCVDPLMICSALSQGAGDACSYDIAIGSCPQGAAYFAPCNSAGIDDGFCLPFNYTGGSEGVCVQGTLDGGLPGDPCLDGNRQNGGLCDPSSLCLGGICAAACNAGTGLAPSCAQNDGGVAIACVPTEGQTGNPSDMGNCSPDCDFTSASGGGCPDTAAAEKCVPEILITGADSAAGLCVAGAASPIPVGQACTASPDLVDPCAAGALCLGSPSLGGNLCVQLCNGVGSVGRAPCGAGSTCAPLGLAIGNSAHVGYCALPDGGL
ncbi:MAG TPA: hypothetical protein VMB50_08060 [Myxococcales bacterium]|nr:hypothetical protein [Myxococcales bacterium]